MKRSIFAAVWLSLPAFAQETIDAFEAPPPGPAVSVIGWAGAHAGVDTRFESAEPEGLSENVGELSGRARLAIDGKLSERVRLLVEGRAWWRGVTQRSFARSKGVFEASLGEAFVDLYSPRVDWRLGNQVVAFGANAAFAPADGLNPRDLRQGFFAAELAEAKLPVFGARASTEVGRVSLTAAYFPFFTPSRYTVFGQDEALLQPGLGPAFPTRIDASIEDALQPHLLETERPRGFPWLGDVGLRATTEVGRFRVGGSWLWMNEKLPRVTLDPELAALLSAHARGEPVSPAVALSVQNRFAAGERLVQGRYARTHVLSLEASTLWKTAQLDADFSYSPGQTFFDLDFNPVTKSALTWVLGVSQAEDSPLLYALTYVGMAVPDVEARELLFLLEPTTAQGASRVAWLHLVVGQVSYRTFSDQLELSVRAGFEPIQRSFAVAPKMTYLGVGRARLWLAAEVYQGADLSPFGYFGRNDRVLAGVEVDLF